MSELVDLFAREYPVWHMVVRGTVVYWFLLLVFRFLLRRDVGSMGVADLLFVVLVADAASNAMQGEYKSINDGLVLLCTLIGWNFLLDWLSYHSPVIARFLEPVPEVLIRHGRVNRKAIDATGDDHHGGARRQAPRRGCGRHFPGTNREAGNGR